jgi:ABC-type nitrate/sulfonate/bicarbonate transport system substrate-binding protein
MKRFTVAVIAGVMAAAMCVGLAACGGGGSSSSGGSTSASSESGGETSGGESGGSTPTEGIKVAYASALDPNDVADQFGLKEAGADVETLNEDSAVVAGLQRGSIEVGNVDYDAAVEAVAEGLPIKIIYISQTTPEYQFVAGPGIESVADLAGKKVGYQEPGSQTEIFAENIVKEEAPEIYDEVEFIALAESSRRAQAMVAGQLDASPLETINLAQLEEQGEFHSIAKWSDLSGDAKTALGTAWVTTDANYEKEKAKLQAFVEDLQKGYNEAYVNEEAWLGLAEETLSEVETKLLPAVYKVYVGENMYPKSGKPAITPAIYKENDRFWRSLGEWEEPVSDEMVAFDLVEAGAKVTEKASAEG